MGKHLAVPTPATNRAESKAPRTSTGMGLTRLARELAGKGKHRLGYFDLEDAA